MTSGVKYYVIFFAVWGLPGGVLGMFHGVPRERFGTLGFGCYPSLFRGVSRG